MLKSYVKSILDEAIKKSYSSSLEYDVEIPEAFFGDFSTNIAMKSAKVLKESPIDIFNNIEKNIDYTYVSKIEFVKGFINITLKDEKIIEYFNLLEFRPFKKVGKRALVEFGSVNPTGPLHLGHGRNLVAGDTLASLLSFAGYDVTREYYINDFGVQVDNLNRTLKIRLEELKQGRELELPEGSYFGDYVKQIAKEYDGSESFAVNWCLDSIKRSAESIGVKYDVWTSERELYSDGKFDEVIEELVSKELLYERDGAKWLKTTLFGDDKDRVVLKADGAPSYFASDILYTREKVERGYDIYINLLGADHHGYIKRYLSTFNIIDFKGSVEVLLTQLVSFLKDGEQIKMSKRAGSFYTLNDLIKEVGSDSCRMFFISKKLDTPIEFDIDLAKSRSSENPVFYVQYAYARICSLIDRYDGEYSLTELSSTIERSIIKKLDEFEEIIKISASTLNVFKVYNYLIELASMFHTFYNSEKIFGKERAIVSSKMAITKRVKEALHTIFDILKINALEKM